MRTSAKVLGGLGTVIVGLSAAPTAGVAQSPGAIAHIRSDLCAYQGTLGEYDGYTAQKAQGQLKARRIWIDRVSEGGCSIEDFIVYEWRDSGSNQDCPLNKPGPFLAEGLYTPELNSSFAISRSYVDHGDQDGASAFGRFSGATSASGAISGQYDTSGFTCEVAGVRFTATRVAHNSGVFSKGGQGYNMIQQYNSTHPKEKDPYVCQGDVCSEGEP